ncbi:hypothetical protein ACFZDF_09115 [Streptomyces sp. NPDC007910]|uniref:hypothetical protein n=1 Tax=unclassified Streptomyces TaxID=2593676 RepID=UPI001F0B5BA8|nr:MULTISPECIES: hypothetical protein [unclassified Streptomyces]
MWYVEPVMPKAVPGRRGVRERAVLYNQSPDRDAECSISWSRTTGTQVSFGRTVGVSIEFLSSEFSRNFSRLQESTKAEQVQAPVPRETIGYWKITLDGHTWTVPGHNVSYAENGTNGATTYIVPRTSDTPLRGEHCE